MFVREERRRARMRKRERRWDYMPFQIVRQDITKMHVDAIVNAANTALQMGGGVCGAIFRAAGLEKLQAACDKLAPIETGGAAIIAGLCAPRKVRHPCRRVGVHAPASGAVSGASPLDLSGIPEAGRAKRLRERCISPNLQRDMWLSKGRGIRSSPPRH